MIHRHRGALALAALVLTIAAGASAEPVTTIRSSGSPSNRVDLVIMGDGYTAAQLAAGKFSTDVENVVVGLFAQQPYAEYRQYFNVHRIDVTSNQSGADHPARGIFVDTALGAAYDCGSITRLICVNSSAVNGVLSRTVTDPNARDIVLVLVNDPEYGGSGGAFAVASLDPSAVELVLHETGHSFGLLADEYGGPPPPSCVLSEPAAANATLVTARASIKWSAWIASSTPVPTTSTTPATPGLYQGAAYCDSGMYRPTNNSKMRSLGVPFEQINTEQHVRRIYNLVSPVDSLSPATTTTIVVHRGAAQAFGIATPAPATHVLSIVWAVDGVPAGSGPSFSLAGSLYSPGGHTLTATVSDGTAFVRSDPSGLLRAVRTWSVMVTGGIVPLDFNGDGRTDLGVYRPEIGRWFIDGGTTTDFGIAGDLPVPGDYNGDGIAELAVFRPSNGTWYINGGATVAWGAAGDIPVPADYDGNGTTDIAVFRPSAGIFYVRGGASIAWGVAGDLPVVADYNGDGVADIAVYRPSTGTWYVRDIATAVFGFAGDVPVPADYNGDGRVDIAVFRPATGTWFVKDQFTYVWGAAGDVPVPLDRNGDGIAELGVFRRATGTWYFKNRITDGTETVIWGRSGDIPLGRAMPPVRPASGDFDGDRKADLTVYRPSSGDWISLRSLSGMTDYATVTWGLGTDTPVGRDYDGDNKMDPAIYRPSTGDWYIRSSASGFTTSAIYNLGLTGSPAPVPADFDGDGRADAAVFRAATGTWTIQFSSNGGVVNVDFGLSGDVPVVADYDGDGRADPAVFRPSTGRWYVLNRFLGTYAVTDWGLSGDLPAAADFDGDGRADLAVFRPSIGRWFIKSSIDGTYQAIDWGLSGDVLVSADYDGDGRADVAVFRLSNATWYVRGLFNRDWGLAGDVAALR